MAAQLIRTPQTDQVQMGAPGEEIRWTESFVFVDSTTQNVWQVINNNIVPKQGSRRDQTLAGTPLVGDFHKTWVARSVDVTPSPSTKWAWNVRVTWSTRRNQQSGRPWFNLTRTTTQRTAAMYRSGSGIFSVGNVPANGTAPFPPTGWITGANVNKVDLYGVPLSVKISQQQIQVDFLWDRTKNNANAMPGLGGTPASSPDPPSEWTSVFVNTRNNAAFLGWPIGYVTYLGWTASESPDEMLVVSHRFLADDWQFLEQRPGPNLGGKPLLDAGLTYGSSPSLPTQSSKLVSWYQPYEELTNFNNLLDFDLGGGNLLTAITTPLPTYPP